MSEDIKDKKAIELVNKVYSSVAYYLPDLTTMEDEKKFEEILDYILDNLGTIDVEKFTEREYAQFAARVAKKFKLVLGAEAYKYVLQEATAKMDIYEALSYEGSLDIADVERIFTSLVDFIPSLQTLPRYLVEEVYTIVEALIPESKISSITDQELAEVAFVVANELGLTIKPKVYAYLQESTTYEEDENLDYLLMAYEFINELVPGLTYATTEVSEEAFNIISEWLNLDDPKTITNLELAQIAYVISNKLNLEAHPQLLDYLEANKSVRN